MEIAMLIFDASIMQWREQTEADRKWADQVMKSAYPLAAHTHYCDEIGCTRKVFEPHIYCDKHVDSASNPRLTISAEPPVVKRGRVRSGNKSYGAGV